MLLKPQSKRSLLEQSFHASPPNKCHSTLFPRILFVDKYFLALAKSRSMFRYRMEIEDETVKYYFTNHTCDQSEGVQLDFEQAKRIFVMLDPDYLEVFTSDEHPNSEHFNLISLANGKVGFDCTDAGEFPPDVLKFFWLRINDFSCCPAMLENIDVWALNAKKFDKLRVEYIHTDEQMANALKQNATHMELSIDSEESFDFGDLALTRAIRNQTTKSCSLDFHYGDVDQPVPLIEAVASAFQNLETFSLEMNGSILYEDDWGVDGLINVLVDYYGTYTKAIECVEKYAQSGNVEMISNTSLDSDVELPTGWIENLKTRAGFENVKHDTYSYDSCNVTKIWLPQKYGDVKSSFSVQFDHNFLDDLPSDDGSDDSGGIFDEPMENESDYSDGDLDEPMDNENDYPRGIFDEIMGSESDYSDGDLDESMGDESN